MSVCIKAIGVYIPEERFLVSRLVDSGVLSREQYDKIGVEQVPVCAADQFPTDLMIQAAIRVLEQNPSVKSEIGFVVATTVCPPEVAMQSAAARVIQELGLDNASGIDVFQGCNALSVQLDLGRSFLLSHPESDYVLLVAGDRWREFAVCRSAAGLVFGDSGGAILLARGVGGVAELIANRTVSDCSFYDMAGLDVGMRFGFKDAGVYQVFKSTVSTRSFFRVNISNLCRVVDQVLSVCGLAKKDLSFVHIPAGRVDVMKKMLRALELDSVSSNLPFLSAHGDLASVGPYCDLSLLLRKAGCSGYGVMATQGTGMFWSAWVLRV